VAAALLALVAAIAFAFGTVLQQKGTLEVAERTEGASWIVRVLKEPIWLAGGLCQAAGWVIQAIALDKGPLIVVQSITMLSLVIALPLGAWLTNQQISRTVVIGAVATVAGIVLFLSVGAPKGGTNTPSAAAWWAAGLAVIAVVGSLVLVGRRTTGATRALLYGAAAGACYAMQTAVTKVFVTLVGQGVVTLVTSWTIYVLVISAVGGFVLQQASLKTGVLAPAMASANSVTLFGGFILGSTVFDERLARGNGRLVPAFLGLFIALIGIGLLARAGAPQSGGEAPEGGPASAQAA
jgi:drug/metabolite transporter (DMT)-like permease